jgi:transposase-like protein
MLGRLPPVNGLLLGPPAGYRFPREVIAVAVRWYLRYGLSYRDVERSSWPSAASRSIT